MIIEAWYWKDGRIFYCEAVGRGWGVVVQRRQKNKQAPAQLQAGFKEAQMSSGGGNEVRASALKGWTGALPHAFPRACLPCVPTCLVLALRLVVGGTWLFGSFTTHLP